MTVAASVGAAVGVDESVAVGDGVGLSVGVPEGVAVRTGVSVGWGVAVAVWVSVAVGVSVFVAPVIIGVVDVLPAPLLRLTDSGLGLEVAVVVGVADDVSEGVGVGESVGVAVSVSVGVAVAVSVGVGLGVVVGVSVGSSGLTGGSYDSSDVGVWVGNTATTAGIDVAPSSPCPAVGEGGPPELDQDQMMTISARSVARATPEISRPRGRLAGGAAGGGVASAASGWGGNGNPYRSGKAPVRFSGCLLISVII